MPSYLSVDDRPSAFGSVGQWGTLKNAAIQGISALWLFHVLQSFLHFAMGFLHSSLHRHAIDCRERLGGMLRYYHRRAA
jgi:hypothetical protein